MVVSVILSSGDIGLKDHFCAINGQTLCGLKDKDVFREAKYSVDLVVQGHGWGEANQCGNCERVRKMREKRAERKNVRETKV